MVAAVSEVKAKLSELLARVRRGDEVVITDRGRPVARLVPLSEQEGALAELAREGLVRPASSSLAEGFLDRPRPRVEGGLAQAVIEERDEGR